MVMGIFVAPPESIYFIDEYIRKVVIHMSSIHIDWDRCLNPEGVNAASEKAAQRATFKKLVASPTTKETTMPTIGIAK